MDFNNSSHLDTTLELPLAEVEAAFRSLDARVDNPGVGTPQQPGQIPGPEIENPTETESDPGKADTGPSSRARPWN
jgi:hypothetical protein